MNINGTTTMIGSLFGSQPIANVNVNVNVKKTKPRLKINVPTTRIDRLAIESNVTTLKPVDVIYPFLDNKAFKLTLDNVRLEIAIQNERIRDINDDILFYNQNVKSINLSKTYTPIQEVFIKNFKIKNKNLRPKKYNQLVENIKIEKGFLIEKRKYKTIKPSTLIVFENLLHKYSTDLTKYTTIKMETGSIYTQSIRQMEINSMKITNLQRKIQDQSIYSLDVCKATIRNHRANLEEAGILIEYLFRGKDKGIKMHINPKILVVFDAYTQKYLCADNQFFKPDSLKSFTENKDNTRTIITVNKTENDKVDFPVLGTASPDLSSSFYRNIQKQEEKSELGGPENNVKVLTLSEKLNNLMLSDTNFSERLAAGEFNYYQRIDKRLLYKEVYSGTMPRVEYAELMVHEILKNLAKIYRQSTPYAGSWRKAEILLTEKIFTINNGNDTFLVNKELMTDILDEWLWRINKAHRWFLKTGIRPLNPHDYLDFSRTHKKEIGFAYTKKAWTTHKKETLTSESKAKKIAKNADLRKKTINNDKKFNTKLNAFKANRISQDQLAEYVNDNLPKQYLDKLSNNLLKINTKFTC